MAWPKVPPAAASTLPIQANDAARGSTIGGLTCRRPHQHAAACTVPSPQANPCRSRLRRSSRLVVLRDSSPKAGGAKTVKFRSERVNCTGDSTTPHTHPSVLKAIAMVDFVGASPCDRSRYSSFWRNTLSSSAQSSTPLGLPVALRPFSVRKSEREPLPTGERASWLIDRCMVLASTTAAVRCEFPNLPSSHFASKSKRALYRQQCPPASEELPRWSEVDKQRQKDSICSFSVLTLTPIPRLCWPVQAARRR